MLVPKSLGYATILPRAGKGSDVTNALRRKTQAALLQTDIALSADNQVVEHIHIEQLASLNNLFGDAHVFRRGRRVAAGVVMRDDHSLAVVPDGLAEQFADAYHGSVEVAD